MPTDAQVEAAVQTGRRLHWEAEQGWPSGYDPERVGAEARQVVATLAAAVDAAPPEYARKLARALVRALEEPMEVPL